MAIRLESNSQSLTLSDPIDESTLESICSHLVVLDSQLKVWKFPHASVAEYFEDQHKSWIDTAPEDVAILLVSCLIECYSGWTPPRSKYESPELFSTKPDLGNHLEPRHPLQRYTRKYWMRHVQITPIQSQEVAGLSEILKRFLGAAGPHQPSSRQYQAWYGHMRINGELDDDWGHAYDVRLSEKPIFGICVFGLHKLLKGWWDEDIDVSQVNNENLDLLAIAAKYGHDELCSELIDRGSDVHKGLDSTHGSAFMEAIAVRQIKTVRLLLAKGVDPNTLRKGRSPLCLAVTNAQDLVELLLEAGADPNTMCTECSFGCALEAAACWKIVDTAELLIKYGANVNLAAEINEYGSPLGAAAYSNSMECAKLFVANGADVNAHLSGNYGSVLAAAIFAFKGVKMVKYLIEEAGADPAILSSSPPPNSPLLAQVFNVRTENSRIEWQEKAAYLVTGGHVQESVLLNIGFPEEDLPVIEQL